jgi:hypothetical protein
MDVLKYATAYFIIMQNFNQTLMEIGCCEVPKLMFQVVEKSGNLENF